MVHGSGTSLGVLAMAIRPARLFVSPEERRGSEPLGELAPTSGRLGAGRLDDIPARLIAPPEEGGADHLIGMTLPELALLDDAGASARLDLLGPRAVLFFFPKIVPAGDPSPDGWNSVPGARGCTPEACGFRDIWANFRRHQVTLVGVSVQSPQELARARRQLHLPFPLLSDEHGRARTALRVPCFEVAGVTYLQRLTLLAIDGTVRRVFHPVFLPGAHPYQVLAEVQALDPIPSGPAPWAAADFVPGDT